MIPPAALLLAALACGQETVAGREAQPPSELAALLRQTLERDPAALDALAGRIEKSRIGERITQASDPERRLADVRDWIRSAPESAARIAVGLAQDDAEGSRHFEDSLLRNTSRSLNANADHVRQSTYGRLKRGRDESKLTDADAAMSDEEKREILKGLFEGKGGMSNQVIVPAEPGEAPADAAALPPDYYDRLSRFNLRGYSAQLMAMQNALNRRRPPGAPKLVETGKLDYATLSYPAYGMRYDLDNLGRRLRGQRNLELARAAGLEGRYRGEELLSPELTAQLEAKAAGGRLDPRFLRRARALERAEAALREFSAAAEAAREPEGISRPLLLERSGRRKEAARWIPAASLEEELQRLEGEAGCLSPELLAQIEACPLPAPVRAAYRGRGRAYEKTLARMKTNAASALARLESDDWNRSVAEVERALAENSSLRRNLSRDIQDFTAVPRRLRQLCRPRTRWRAWLDNLVERCLPGTAWGRRLRGRSARRGLLQDAFVKIASGDREAARAVLVGAPAD
ncbi:MAG: hypothetical protein PHF00_00885 [Elusimicrobia bacterium]|nr:hypothetical protein [Elusimicrobiota bacterium]